jgi:hypothetical protein
MDIFIQNGGLKTPQGLFLYHINLRKSEKNIKELEITIFLSYKLHTI